MKTIPDTTNNILSTAQAFNNCVEHNDPNKANWAAIHRERIEKTLLDVLSHGSGIDCNWKIEINPKNITCYNSFHNMNSDGYYCGYIDFRVIIKTDRRDIWGNLDYEIKGNFGKNQDLKEYLYDCFNSDFENL